jgi:hypothetical protein
VIPFLGWVVGVVLRWISRLWTTRDKLIGTLGGLSMAEATSTPLSASGSDTPVGSSTPSPAAWPRAAVVASTTHEVEVPIGGRT